MRQRVADPRICPDCGAEYNARSRYHQCDPEWIAEMKCGEEEEAQQEADGEIAPWWTA